jgi:hypothetical protein
MFSLLLHHILSLLEGSLVQLHGCLALLHGYGSAKNITAVGMLLALLHGCLALLQSCF